MIVKNKRIMVIGGTGALGTALTNRWCDNNDILVFSRNEHKQEDMKRQYPNVLYRIGDVKDKGSILRTMLEFKPHIIVNTAAMKTVWVAQDNPYETILTNIVGHQYLIDCIKESRHQIETLMFISTDKACSPVNVYGMSKGIAEQMYVNFAKEQSDIKVALCRYGNVLDSTGSLIPVFKDIVERGAESLPITNFDMTRFLITLDEAIDLIEWSYESEKSHGKIVVPKLQSMKIIDFAKAIAKSLGKEDIQFHKIPIRNGEKLHEEMISSIEYQRVEDGNEKYVMIGYDRNNEDYDHTPLNSEFHLMNSEESYQFLVDKDVL
jgi:UDP-N-acetylglucosamine 4,6-dehydratase